MKSNIHTAFIRAVVLIAITSVSNAYACSCRGSSSEANLKRSSLIFSGTAISARKLDTEKPRGPLVTTFEVSEIYKGPQIKTVEIQTDDSSSCKYNFKIGPDVVVYAYGSAPEGYRTDSCLMHGQANYSGYAEKKKNLISTLAKEPYNLEILLLLSEFYLHYNDYAEAQETLSRLIALEPGNPSFYLKRAHSRYAFGLFEDALADFKAALRLDDNNKDALAGKNHTLLKLGRLSELGDKNLDFSNYLQNPADKPFDLSNVNLKKSIFSGAYLNNQDFSNKDLTGADFTGASLYHCNFSYANLSDTRFTNSKNITMPVFTGTNLNGADFNGAQLSGSDFKGVDLKNADFSNAKLQSSNLRSATIGSANFLNADLTRSDLSNTVWEKTKIGKANFLGVDAHQSQFIQMDFTNSVFATNPKHKYYTEFTNLIGADFSSSTLGTLNFGMAVYSCSTKFPKDYSPINNSPEMFPLWSKDCNSSPPATFLSGGHKFANGPRIFNVSVDRANFRYMDLSGFWFGQANMVESDFAYANLDRVRFYEVNISGSTFNNVSFVDAELGKTDLSGSIFINADLSNTKFKDVKFDNACTDETTVWPEGFDPFQNGLTKCKQPTGGST